MLWDATGISNGPPVVLYLCALLLSIIKKMGYPIIQLQTIYSCIYLSGMMLLIQKHIMNDASRIEEIRTWMSQNFMKLNENKIECIVKISR